MRYRLADEVGLGKTIEAGLILCPLLSKQEFIETGRAYASSLSLQSGQQVILVLIAMQKLASISFDRS